MMNHIDISKRAFDEEIRFEAIAWLATCNDGGDLPEWIREDFLYEDSHWIEAFETPFPEEIASGVEEDVAGYLIEHGIYGFLAKVVVPVPISATATGYTSHGWGYCRIFWMYAESPEALFDKAVSKVKAWREKKLAALRNKKGDDQ